MSAHRPYLLLGEKQLARVEDTCRVASANWWDHWCTLPLGETEIHARIATHEVSEASSFRWYHCPAWSLDCRVRFDPGSSALWIGQMLEAREADMPPRDSALSVRMVEKLLDTLVDGIAGKDLLSGNSTRHPPWEEVTVDQNWLEAASGAVIVEITWSLGAIEILFSPATVRTLAFTTQMNRQAKQSLYRRGDVLNAAAITLEVTGRTLHSLTFADIAALSVGDVLLLEGQITDPWLVKAQNGDVVAVGELGKRGDRRALRLNPKNPN